MYYTGSCQVHWSSKTKRPTPGNSIPSFWFWQINCFLISFRTSLTPDLYVELIAPICLRSYWSTCPCGDCLDSWYICNVNNPMKSQGGKNSFTETWSLKFLGHLSCQESLSSCFLGSPLRKRLPHMKRVVSVSGSQILIRKNGLSESVTII